MRKLALLALLTVSLAACAAQPARQSIALKDGSTLYVDANGQMRMLDSARHPLMMAEGQPMEAMDGSIYVMKNDPVWNTLRLKGSLSPKL
ncbi:MAG: CopK family periplasmic copper-binding protein [Betaproteobacteria bacterium]|nr:CopK family periplasmic copper-binding protein [Betaproteobacteria bacterium]